MSREAMKQEPTAWQCQCGKAYTVTCISSKPPKREWVGLTEKELKTLCDENHIMFGAYTVYQNRLLDFIQAIEAKLKEKNGGEYRNGATTERTKLNQENT